MKDVIAIVGPTASGKTKLSVEIAKKINGEIVSADSRQVYLHIPVATSVPSPEDRKLIKHYFIEELNLEEEFNAGEYGKKAREVIEKILELGKTPVITGGSGLYVRSLIEGFFEEEVKDKEIRAGLNEKLKEKGREFLYNELKEIDKIAAAAMLPTNIRRIIRALEIYYATGKKISDLQKNNAAINFNTHQYGLMLDRKYLYERINNRVDEMIKAGLIEEVRNLWDKGYTYHTHNSLNTVGVKEVMKYFEGEYSYEEMAEMIKQNTRRYAKRQITWFNKDKKIKWVVVEHTTDFSVLSDYIIADFNKRENNKNS
jgi:tRNA dimethylallyltransferase